MQFSTITRTKYGTFNVPTNVCNDLYHGQCPFCLVGESDVIELDEGILYCNHCDEYFTCRDKTKEE